MIKSSADVVVIGGGIAGASVGALLAASHRVIVLEREPFAGMHSTGRSAALFSEIYGKAPVRALSRASRSFLYTPPPGFADGAIVSARGCLHIASSEQLGSLDSFCALPDVAPAVVRLAGEGARALCPILREDYVMAAAFEAASADVDVNVLHQGWLRQLKTQGGELIVEAEVLGLTRQGETWRVETKDRQIETSIVINAAGAWADQVAKLASVNAANLQPFRRTALIVDAPGGTESGRWPMVIDIDEQFYFKPDAGALLLSPADQTPVEPCDAQPEEWDIACAVDRVVSATTLEVRRVRRSWAGLRTFAPDRNPVVGYAPGAPGFFWLAGQGGYGIQTCPALAELAAALVKQEPAPSQLVEFGLKIEDLAPDRSVEVRG